MDGYFDTPVHGSELFGLQQCSLFTFEPAVFYMSALPSGPFHYHYTSRVDLQNQVFCCRLLAIQ